MKPVVLLKRKTSFFYFFPIIKFYSRSFHFHYVCNQSTIEIEQLSIDQKRSTRSNYAFFYNNQSNISNDVRMDEWID